MLRFMRLALQLLAAAVVIFRKCKQPAWRKAMWVVLLLRCRLQMQRAIKPLL